MLTLDRKTPGRIEAPGEVMRWVGTDGGGSGYGPQQRCRSSWPDTRPSGGHEALFRPLHPSTLWSGGPQSVGGIGGTDRMWEKTRQFPSWREPLEGTGIGKEEQIDPSPFGEIIGGCRIMLFVHDERRLRCANHPGTTSTRSPQPHGPTVEFKRRTGTEWAWRTNVGDPGTSSFDHAARLCWALRPCCRVMRPLIGPQICHCPAARELSAIFGVSPRVRPPSCAVRAPSAMASEVLHSWLKMTGVSISLGRRRALRVQSFISLPYNIRPRKTVSPGTAPCNPRALAGITTHEDNEAVATLFT